MSFTQKITKWWNRQQLEHRFNEVVFDPSARLELKPGVDRIGARTRVAPNTWLSSASGGSIDIGERCDIGLGTLVLTYGGKIRIGNDCSFNPYCVIYGHGDLEIGNFVRIATHTVIVPANHNFERLDVPIHHQGLSMKGVRIGDDVWIGAGVKILDGVEIGTGSVIAAGSVVTRSIEPFSVAAGVPARVIKRRGH